MVVVITNIYCSTRSQNLLCLYNTGFRSGRHKCSQSLYVFFFFLIVFMTGIKKLSVYEYWFTITVVVTIYSAKPWQGITP